jgi:putative endonuclease
MTMFGFFKKRKAPDHGEWGEQVAAELLKKSGYSILGMRVRFGAREEIDIVARDGGILVFVEVKTRKSENYGRPSVSVDRKKRHLLSRAAVRYLKRLKNPRVCFRFDIVEVIGEPDGEKPKLRHIENAFTLDKIYALM